MGDVNTERMLFWSPNLDIGIMSQLNQITAAASCPARQPLPGFTTPSRKYSKVHTRDLYRDVRQSSNLCYFSDPVSAHVQNLLQKIVLI